MTAKSPDGSTIMMFHDMTWLGVSFGAYEDKYALENFVVGPRMAISQGPCFAVKRRTPPTPPWRRWRTGWKGNPARP